MHPLDSFYQAVKEGLFDPMGNDMPVEDAMALIEMGNLFPEEQVVEIGTWAGFSTWCLGMFAEKVYSVDHWQGSKHDSNADLAKMYPPVLAFQTFCRNMAENLFDSVFPCCGSSELWASIWPFPVDLVYIDAEHTYEAVKKDIALWLPHVRPGGMIAGHDYGLFPGVKQAVDEAFGDRVKTWGATIWNVRV